MAKKTTKKKTTKKAAKKSISKKTETKKPSRTQADQAVMDAIALTINADIYSQQMVSKLSREYGLSTAKARATIAAIAEPIMAQLNQK